MDLKAEARQLVRNLDQRMGPSPYDVAWLAQVQGSTNGHPRWADLGEWLLEHQHPDGSWGGEIEYYHDRVMCTLAAATALFENGFSHRSEEAVQAAQRYLWSHLHLLHRDPFELVGFELILPTLLAQARDKGLAVPPHACGYEKIQTAKLRLIPPEMYYSPRITTVHSLEFLGRSADPVRLGDALTRNGSLGNSPATTAYYLSLGCDDERALQYLEYIRARHEHVMVLYPFRTFELVWVLNNFSFCLSPITDFADQATWELLLAQMGPDGIGLDPTFGIPDGDNTAVCSRLFVSAGYDVDPSILTQFEDRKTGTFRSFEYERNRSVGTNAHALEALVRMPDYPECRKVQRQVMLMLLDKRVYNMYWVDKWHASPYYATVHVLVALLGEGGYMASACSDTADWLVHTQRDDGSWGYFDRGTAEETAYALIALLHYNRHRAVDMEALRRGASYLVRSLEMDTSRYPPLWIDKCLYVPYDIVRSAILAALILYEERFGSIP
jgi:halimadienyl-diphosphate synthase